MLPLALLALTAAAVTAGFAQASDLRMPVRDADNLFIRKTREFRRSSLPNTPEDTPSQSTPQRPSRSNLRDIMDAETETVMRKWGDAYKNAETLQYISVVTYQPRSTREKAFKVSMKFVGSKPNLIRVEVKTPSPREDGVMISDGRIIWEYCPNLNIYATTPVPNGPFLMQGELRGLRYVAASMLYHPDPFSALIANSRTIKIIGNETVEGERCVVVSRQMTRSVSVVWLSEKDHLPRLTVRYDMRQGRPVEAYREERRDVEVDASIPVTQFRFRPPRGTKRHVFPRPEDNLLRPGTEAPDFAAENAEDVAVRFASLKGKTVMLMFWSIFCPTCRAEMETLNKLQAEFADKDVVIVAVNVDYPDSIKDYLAENPATRVKLWRDPTEGREKTSPYALFGIRGVPTTYLIDKEGKVVTSWFGYEDNKADELREAIKKQIEK
jgi:peroxiredoxin/outer membrane lipoprotein-sorting protein